MTETASAPIASSSGGARDHSECPCRAERAPADTVALDAGLRYASVNAAQPNRMSTYSSEAVPGQPMLGSVAVEADRRRMVDSLARTLSDEELCRGGLQHVSTCR